MLRVNLQARFVVRITNGPLRERSCLFIAADTMTTTRLLFFFQDSLLYCPFLISIYFSVFLYRRENPCGKMLVIINHMTKEKLAMIVISSDKYAMIII